MSPLARPRPVNLAENAFARLERMVVTLELQPGLELTERELLARVGLGRTPVREAVQRLAWMGLIEIRPRLGLRIAPIGDTDFARVLRLRALLEPLFARTATLNATAAQRARIAACRVMMQESVSLSDLKLFLAADKVFDGLMAEACGDPVLVRALDPLQVQARRLWFHHVGHKGLAHSAHLHMPVMAAFVAADADAAGSAMHRLVMNIHRTDDQIGA